MLELEKAAKSVIAVLFKHGVLFNIKAYVI